MSKKPNSMEDMRILLLKRLAELKRERRSEDERPQNMKTPKRCDFRKNDDQSVRQDSNDTSVMVKEPPNLLYNLSYNWQDTKYTLKDKISYLYNSELLSDVHFIVGSDNDQERLPAHKFVMSINSAVFDAMFNGNLSSNSEMIRIPDVEPDAFRNLLKYFYTEDCQIGPDSVMTTLYTAKKYAAAKLEDICVDYLKKNATPENVFHLLSQGEIFGEKQLISRCWDIIDKDAVDVLQSEGFKAINQQTLELLLKRSTLRAREIVIFRAVQQWAEAECLRRGLPRFPDNQRAVLGDTLHLVRLGQMTQLEYAQGPARCELYSTDDIVQTLLYYVLGKKPSYSGQYFDVPRYRMAGEERTVSRFKAVKSRWGYKGTPDRVRFTVNKTIFIVGFQLYGSHLGNSEHEAQIQVDEYLSSLTRGANIVTYKSDGSESPVRVMFYEPIEISPNVLYVASVKMKGADTYYGIEGRKTVEMECQLGDKIVFQFSSLTGSNNGTSADAGQIPSILFYS